MTRHRSAVAVEIPREMSIALALLMIPDGSIVLPFSVAKA
ncbi:MAG: hypothetical protein Hyperionvirus23_31 [Hyperionvirus sp.]|uniref:Uncharacterized protein n=1 Tax=Hyperionvirus sp. TaxID=2487770 RepID=A0A3G5ACN5_9VIRU|nr:MAG: hypothetical protein Hyperionvirus23_31 [Hyperionvirus sp.]